MLADINGNLADLRSEAMASQRFCLRWNNHQSNLLSVFDQLLHDEAFVDVTLAVEGQLLRAHKMVLSACSPYFQALFTNHPDKHPIVILKDVPYVDMRSLLDFMYRGEVSVDQDRLPAFLRVAESLRIKGLTEVNEEKCDLPSITSSLLGNQNILSQHQQQQQQQQHQQQQQQPPPNLHRINQIGSSHHHHGGGGGNGGGGGQKRYHHMSSHPLLGSALTAPKRKRGSPEMMEMKMGIDFQSETSTGNGNANNSGSNRSANSTPGPITGRKDDSMENGERDTPEPVTPKIKKELEPTPSTSAQDNQPSLPKDISFEICGSAIQPMEMSSEHIISTGNIGYIDDNEEDAGNNDHLHQQQHHHHNNTTIINRNDNDDTVDAVVNNINNNNNDNDNEDDDDDDDDDNNDHGSIGDGGGGGGAYIKAESGIHFLTDEQEEDERVGMLVPKSETSDTEPEIRKQLLEYLIQNDGSVVCKWCGEVLPSRTRWYRHKYKLHVTSQVTQPAPLFKCHTCNAYFKSRKGYIGHLSSRHSDDNENDENREESMNKKNRKSSSDQIGKSLDWEQQREKEEKLVADIIDRVKRECEAQGETVTRRGYSRRSTVMNT